VSYPGSKGQAGTWQRIIGQMPPHDLYVEPFAGSAQVFFRKALASTSLLLDADAGVSVKLGATIRSVIPDVSGRVVSVICMDALDWIARADCFNSQAVVYCDPPYLLSTRKARRYYNHEFTDDQHARLLTLLQALKCRVLLSGYPSKLYSSQLRDWRCLSYRTRTRGSTVTECLWCNFPEPTELHDWRYAGKNFRQRLAFRRLAGRWLARLEGMPVLKRGYVLNAIAQRQS